MKRFSTVLAMMLTLMILFSASVTAESGTPIYSESNMFTARDLEQTADLDGAVTYTVKDGEDIRLTEAGVYVLTGAASNVTVYVEAEKDAKVHIVLDGVTVTNESFPVIYVTSADKVFVTTSADSSLSVTGSFSSDGDTKTDGVIFSKSDLTLNGTAVLTISSSENGVVGKDDLKITGGVYVITAKAKAVEANDSIRVAGGTLTLSAGTDGLHAENSSDNTLGYVYISGGVFTISAGDDGIHGNSVVQIDGGEITIKAAEGVEGTYIQINGGTLNIQSTDDGINAARKSGAYTPTVEINGGDITINMGSGDTDGVDANGNIIVNGGTIRVNGNSTFDYDGTAQYNGGTIICNGQEVASIPNQMMGGFGGRGGFGGFGGFDGGNANGSGWDAASGATTNGFGGSNGGRGGRGR